MKTMKKYLFFAAAITVMASCTSDTLVNGDSEYLVNGGDANQIVFSSSTAGLTRADLIGATAAEKLGGMFVVEGTKGSEQTNSPSTDVVFDNYLVGYTANTAGTTESNTNNWEYVGKQTGIDGKLSGTTWTALHDASTDAKAQSIKYWDYSQDQYDFIAWSTGKREAVTDAAVAGSKVKVTRINTGSTLSSNGFTMEAKSAADLLECYYTDINTVTKASNKYGQPVTLKFKNMAAKVRVALYETVPGYSVKDVKFYTKDADDPTAPDDLGSVLVTGDDATLFTTGIGNVLPQSGTVTVMYPHIGTTHRNATPAQTKDYNMASVTVTAGTSTSTTQAFGALYNFAATKESTHIADGDYIGRTITTATYAGDVTKDYYAAVIPNTNGKTLTLRLDYTLVATDGQGEEIKVYGAKAVVPATYTVWQPNYAYTYIFKISDNSNGWTSQTATDPKGLFPITFDAVVASFVDVNAEQTTVTTVATPSITTYQQGHDHKNKDEYSKSQKAGADQTNVKELYVQVMDNSGATPSLKTDLNTTGKSLLFKITKSSADYVASEAEVMDALQNRASDTNWESASPIGRNGITLTTNTNIVNNVASIVNGVDDQPITVTSGTAAKIAIASLETGTYAYVYSTTVPTADEKVYHVAAGVTDASSAANYYEVKLTDIATTACAANAEAAANKVYFVKNLKADGTFDSYTFKQTKVGDDVEGLYEASIPGSKGTSDYSDNYFYFDVYNQNNGAYAVKVIKVVN